MLFHRSTRSHIHSFCRAGDYGSPESKALKGVWGNILVVYLTFAEMYLQIWAARGKWTPYVGDGARLGGLKQRGWCHGHRSWLYRSNIFWYVFLLMLPPQADWPLEEASYLHMWYRSSHLPLTKRGQLPKNIKVSLQVQTALVGNTTDVYSCHSGSCDGSFEAALSSTWRKDDIITLCFLSDGRSGSSSEAPWPSEE